MQFQPKVLNPIPDPFFARELRKIDPDLRVRWGYGDYLVNQWVIERRHTPERYFTVHASLEGGERFVDQPIFDTDQPLYNEYGEHIGYQQVGTRKYDLAPEWEYVCFVDQLHSGVLGEIKRAYAWERNHPISRLAAEKKMEEEAQKKAEKMARLAAIDVNEVVDEAKVKLGKKRTFNG